jgi:hypothetical protein
MGSRAITSLASPGNRLAIFFTYLTRQPPPTNEMADRRDILGREALLVLLFERILHGDTAA